MNLVVEDGTNIPGANSYASADDMYLFAAERNIEVSNDPMVLEGLLMKAMDYIETFTNRFSGVRFASDQPLSFPRAVRNSYGSTINTLVPSDIKKAQIVLALAATTTDLLPVVAAGATMDTTRKTIGPITVEYEKTTHSVTPRVPLADALLRPYFLGGAGQPIVVRG